MMGLRFEWLGRLRPTVARTSEKTALTGP